MAGCVPTETHEHPYPSLTSLRAAMPGLGPPLDSLGLVGGRTQPVLGAWGPGGGQGQLARRPLRKEELEWLEEQVWRNPRLPSWNGSFLRCFSQAPKVWNTVLFFNITQGLRS